MVKSPSLKKFGTAYLVYKKHLLKSYRFIERAKMAFVITLFLLSIGIYGYFVNVSSTKGYFVKVEREKLNEVNFQNEIVKIDIRKEESKLSNSILTLNKLDNLTGNIITITPIQEMVYRK